MPAAENHQAFITAGGEMGALMRVHDWSTSPLDRPESWPQSLRSVVGLLLNSKFPMFVAWGPKLGFLYNDSYAEILGAKHPRALGRPFVEIWSEIWSDISPLVDAAMAGNASYLENLPLRVNRHGHDEDTWFTFSYSPVRGEDGAVAGMFCAVAETTNAVRSERRREALLKLDERLSKIANTGDLSFAASKILGEALGASRVGYGAVDPEAGTIFVERNWFSPGFDNLAGTHRFDDYGTYIDDLRQGRPVANADVQVDPRTAANADSFRVLGIRAHLDVPVMENGRTVGQLFVHSPVPRKWSDDEIAFVRDFAERTRAAIARRGAELALRDSEARFRALATVGSSAIYRMGPDWREMRQLDGAGFIVDTKDPTTNWLETYIPTDEHPRICEAIELAIRVRGPFELEHRVVRVDGTVGWAHSRAIPLFDEDGRITEWFGAARDVTGRIEADQSFTRLFQASPAPFLVLAPDAPRFTIEEVNDAYLAATMRTREELVGRGVFDAFPDNPDDATIGGVSTLRASLERALATRKPNELPGLKYDIARPDGSFEERWWSPINSPVLNERGEVEAIIHNANDVTEQRRVEAAVRESEERYRRIVEGADDFAIITLDAGGIITSWNFGAERMMGFTETEALGRHGDVFFTPEDRQTGAPDHEMARAESDGRAVNERWHMRKDGSRFWGSGLMIRLDEDGGGYLKIFRDRTAEHEAENALRMSEARLRELAETLEQRVAERTAERDRLWELSPDLLTVVDYEGRLRRVNPSWTRVLGYAEDRLLTRPYAEILHPDEIPSIAAVLADMRATGRPVLLEDRLLAADGTWRTFVWTLSPEQGADLLYGVGRDVTDERARSAELAQAQEALRQSQKMEAMGSLTGGVAHDFNNLLTPILGSLDMLQRKGLGNEREQRLIAGAVQSADRAKTLVQRLLAFARRQPLQSTSVDLGPLVRGMAELVRSTTGPQVRVVVDAADDLPPAKADPNQLEMAILNLAVNARDAMPEGGTLRISIDAETVGRQHRATVPPGRYLRLSIADTGNGMDEPTLRRAIEPFFSTKGVGKGTGLGLSMVHGLASQLGGALTISSSPGVGTNVELWLPQSAEPVVSIDTDAKALPASQGSGTALLVDDEDLVRLSTADMLIDLGYSVVEAASAEEALRLIDRGLQPDVLVTDHLMPGMSGTELARSVQSSRPQTKVLVVSGYAETEGIAPDLPRLTKPFRNADLAASLAALA